MQIQAGLLLLVAYFLSTIDSQVEENCPAIKVDKLSAGALVVSIPADQ
jgi:hypothetical protein